MHSLRGVDLTSQRFDFARRSFTMDFEFGRTASSCSACAVKSGISGMMAFRFLGRETRRFRINGTCRSAPGAEYKKRRVG